jgi:hypothetical protein
LEGPIKRHRGHQAEPGLPDSPHDIFDFDTVQTSIITLFLRLGRFEREAGIEEMFASGLIPHSWEAS